MYKSQFAAFGLLLVLVVGVLNHGAFILSGGLSDCVLLVQEGGHLDSPSLGKLVLSAFFVVLN